MYYKLQAYELMIISYYLLIVRCILISGKYDKIMRRLFIYNE